MKTTKRKKLSKALIDFNEKPIKELIAVQKESLDNNVKMLENGLTISIDQLPECRHKQRLQSLVMDSKLSKVVVVANRNKDDTWQAYIGYPDIRDLKPIIDDYTDTSWCCENIRDRIQVMMMGDKMDKNAACKLFPEWDKNKYKENKHEASHTT